MSSTVGLGLEPGVPGWKAHTNPLSYCCTHQAANAKVGQMVIPGPRDPRFESHRLEHTPSL